MTVVVRSNAQVNRQKCGAFLSALNRQLVGMSYTRLTLSAMMKFRGEPLEK